MIRVDENGGFTTETKYVGHDKWPCPSARGESETCEEAYKRWRKRTPIRKVREVENEKEVPSEI